MPKTAAEATTSSDDTPPGDTAFGDPAFEPGAVVGASGSGKSTLLHLIGAFDEPDQGTIMRATRGR